MSIWARAVPVCARGRGHDDTRNVRCGTVNIMAFLFVAALTVSFIMGSEQAEADPSTPSMQSCSVTGGNGSIGSDVHLGQLTSITDPCVSIRSLDPSEDSLPLKVCEGDNMTVEAKIYLPYSWYRDRGQLISPNSIKVTGLDNGQTYIQGLDTSGTDNSKSSGHAKKGRWKASVTAYVNKSVYLVTLTVNVAGVTSTDEYARCIELEQNSVTYKHCVKTDWFHVVNNKTGKICQKGPVTISTPKNGSEKNKSHEENPEEKCCVLEPSSSFCEEQFKDITRTLLKIDGNVQTMCSCYLQHILLVLLTVLFLTSMLLHIPIIREYSLKCFEYCKRKLNSNQQTSESSGDTTSRPDELHQLVHPTSHGDTGSHSPPPNQETESTVVLFPDAPPHSSGSRQRRGREPDESAGESGDRILRS